MAIGQKTQGAELLVAGDFSADLSARDGHDRNNKIAVSMATEGMEYME